ncbi:MAG: type II toxin-antitoxin system RelE/ParE family toxin [Anaerolineae bacterium]|nr:type II toxin-antitoxin system RelE/ParE family toxin [Anaerolineae bacterium]
MSTLWDFSKLLIVSKSVTRMLLMIPKPLPTSQKPDNFPESGFRACPYRVYKTRIKNSDVQKGKSGGYRVMYYLETSEKLVLLIIFTKSDESNLPTDVIRRLIEEYRRRG